MKVTNFRVYSLQNTKSQNTETHRYSLGVPVSEKQFSTIKVVIQVENGTVAETETDVFMKLNS